MVGGMWGVEHNYGNSRIYIFIKHPHRINYIINCRDYKKQTCVKYFWKLLRNWNIRGKSTQQQTQKTFRRCPRSAITIIYYYVYCLYRSWCSPGTNDIIWKNMEDNFAIFRVGYNNNAAKTGNVYMRCATVKHQSSESDGNK